MYLFFSPNNQTEFSNDRYSFLIPELKIEIITKIIGIPKVTSTPAVNRISIIGSWPSIKIIHDMIEGCLKQE